MKLTPEQAVKWIPGNLHNLLWSFPGMGYFLYHWVLTIICKHMVFPDEE